MELGVFSDRIFLDREELEYENWLHLAARLTGRSYEQTRVDLLEFLNTDLLNVSDETCVSFLDPLVDYWDIDLTTFGMEIVLSRRLAPMNPKKFEYVERAQPARRRTWVPGISSEPFSERRCRPR